MRTSKKHNTRQEKANIDKRRTKIAMKVLCEIKEHFLETKEFINDCIEQERLKEIITVEEVIFLFTCLEAKS